MTRGATLDQSWTYRRPSGGPTAEQPGLLVLFTGERATLVPIPLGKGTHVLGRDGVAGVLVDDGRMSRRHAEVAFDGSDWHVRDLDSHNGTFLDGKRLAGPRVTRDARVLRLGNSLFGLLSDVGAYEGAAVALRDDVVLGPTLRRAWVEIESAARSAAGLHLVGESGSGKEVAARHYHLSGPRAGGPFVAVNCATLQPALAERLLFGARKGAYSGADADVDGHVQAAQGGTLFLDEIAELAPAVQAKVLRLVEAREVVPLGAARPRQVDLAICTATHRDLRAEVAAGRFREDLLYRIATPSVTVPPLRDRLDDIAWIVQLAVGRLGLKPHISLVETCVLRGWPGNVRELQAEVGQAAARAAAKGSARVEAAHLGRTAGQPVAAAPGGAAEDANIVATLRQAGGNVSRAARELGMHRTQLRRWVAKNRERIDSVDDDDEAP